MMQLSFSQLGGWPFLHCAWIATRLRLLRQVASLSMELLSSYPSVRHNTHCSGDGEGKEDFVETFMTCYDTGERSKCAMKTRKSKCATTHKRDQNPINFLMYALCCKIHTIGARSSPTTSTQ